MPPAPPSPLDHAAACAKDAANPASCICGNCASDAVTSTCLRYTAVQGDWRLAECRPGTQCDAVFPPGTGSRAGDTIVSCPCGAKAPPSGSRPAPPSRCERSAPAVACAPMPSGVEATLRNVFVVVGVAATVAAVTWLLLRLVSKKEAPGDLPPLPPYTPSDGGGADADLPPLPPYTPSDGGRADAATGLGGADAELGPSPLEGAPILGSSSVDGWDGAAP